jgi:hypothetical protein
MIRLLKMLALWRESSVRLVRLQPHDLVVLRVPQPMKMIDVAKLRERIFRLEPTATLLVLTPDSEIEVVRRGAQQHDSTIQPTPEGT